MQTQQDNVQIEVSLEARKQASRSEQALGVVLGKNAKVTKALQFFIIKRVGSVFMPDSGL